MKSCHCHPHYLSPKHSLAVDTNRKKPQIDKSPRFKNPNKKKKVRHKITNSVCSSLIFAIPKVHTTIFCSSIIRTNPDNATIRDPAVKSWQVNVVKIDEDLFFGTGWEVFVSENSLKLGDFLLFNYDGTSLFDVKIFLRNGCTKGVVATRQTLPTVKIKEEDEAEENEEMRPIHKVGQSDVDRLTYTAAPPDRSPGESSWAELCFSPTQLSMN